MFQNILKKGNIGCVELKNRMIMPAMGSHHGTHDGRVNEELIEYYGARARGGFGLIIVEFTCVDPAGKALPGQLMADTDQCIEGFKRLADRIHQEGGKIFLQLQHSGRQTVSHFTGRQPVAPSPIPCPVNKELPRELTIDEIRQIVEKYGDAAVRAKKAGFDGVEIHGAHGYLPAQFLSSYSNKRLDEYGGDIMGRSKFAVEIIDDIKKKCGRDFPISFRISGDERVEGGRRAGETAIIAKYLEQAGADAIHVSTGVYASMRYMVAPANVPNGFNLEDTQVIKKAVTIPVIAVGRINDPSLADYVVESGIADFVALGRASLADPEFAKKVAEDRADEISPCVGCLTRCNGAPGIDPDDHGVSCMINPFTGHELFMKIEPASAPRKIIVVGGGPAGLEAAWICAARGNDVTLYEKDNKPGGQVIPGNVPPAKHELARALRYYIKMCEKFGVNIQLGTEADAETIIKANPDEVILATGAVPVLPDIENEGITVVQAVDVLNGKVYAGDRSLIVGGGMVGLETAEYLLSQNKKAAVVEMTEQTGAGLNPSIQYFIYETLKKGEVELLTNTKVERFTPDGIVASTPEGEIKRTGYDTIILAIGAKAYNPLEEKLKSKVKSLHVIGDAVKSRRIVDAVEEAARLAVTI